MLSRTFAILAAALIMAGPAVAGTSSGSGGHGGGGGGASSGGSGHASGGGHAGIGGRAGGQAGGVGAGHIGAANGRYAGIGPAAHGAAHAVAVHADAKHGDKPRPHRTNVSYLDQTRIAPHDERIFFDACAPIDVYGAGRRTDCQGPTKAAVDRTTGLPIR